MLVSPVPQDKTVIWHSNERTLSSREIFPFKVYIAHISSHFSREKYMALLMSFFLWHFYKIIFIPGLLVIAALDCCKYRVTALVSTVCKNSKIVVIHMSVVADTCINTCRILASLWTLTTVAK